jgi:hypothetical protein
MDERPPPTTGTPEGAAWFKAQLEELGQTQSGFARWLEKRGDDRKPGTILRHVQRMANGEARVSGEMRVILNMMQAGAKKQAKKSEHHSAPA